MYVNEMINENNVWINELIFILKYQKNNKNKIIINNLYFSKNNNYYCIENTKYKNIIKLIISSYIFYD